MELGIENRDFVGGKLKSAPHRVQSEGTVV